MNNGTLPVKIDHRDYSHFATLGAISQPVFPSEYDTDAHLWMPNQNALEPHFNNPPLPFGCSDYTQADLSTDIDAVLKNPALLEDVTHANAKGGADLRTALKGAVSLGWITSFFNIQAYRPLDYFDTIRYASLAGVPERRSISWATPWFPSWEAAALRGESIMKMPTDIELGNIRRNSMAYSWHNSKLAGWTTKNTTPLLRNKSWQGDGIGDKGWLYFPREVVNVVMMIPGTAAFSATRSAPVDIKTINVSILQWVLSHYRLLLAYFY